MQWTKSEQVYVVVTHFKTMRVFFKTKRLNHFSYINIGHPNCIHDIMSKLIFPENSETNICHPWSLAFVPKKDRFVPSKSIIEKKKILTSVVQI